MSYEQIDHRVRVLALLVLACLGHAISAGAQEHLKPTIEKWRPKDGTYATPDATYALRCPDFGDFEVDLGENHIGGNEWGCDVKKLTDSGAAMITLETECLEGTEEDAKPYKLIFSLKKIDDKTFSYRSSRNGKFKGVPAQVESYCPEKDQQTYVDAVRRNHEEEKAKAARKKAEPE